MAIAADLLAYCSEWEVDQASKAGEIVHLSRGRYALDTAKPARKAAHQLTAAVSHLSAAQIHGWEVLHVPDRPWVTVPRNRKVSPQHRDLAEISYGSTTTDVVDGVTAPLRTVLDCARRLPFGEALPVADSALRHGDVDIEALCRAAASAQGPGATQVRMVAAHADGRADNAIESALRSIAIGVPGLAVVPQLEIELPGFTVHPDLVDADLRLVIEAEGWIAHGSTPERFAKDLQRYTQLVLSGHVVVRFGRDAVVDRPETVHADLVAAVALSRELTALGFGRAMPRLE